MSKRSVKKVRHYAPAPTIKARVKNNRAIKDGGTETNLMVEWRQSVPRYQKEKKPFLEARKVSNEREDASLDK